MRKMPAMSKKYSDSGHEQGVTCLVARFLLPIFLSREKLAAKILLVNAPKSEQLLPSIMSSCPQS